MELMCGKNMRQPTQRSPRPKERDSNRLLKNRQDICAKEMVQFVREFQREKHPTQTIFQKRKPLPEIKQSDKLPQFNANISLSMNKEIPYPCENSTRNITEQSQRSIQSSNCIYSDIISPRTYRRFEESHVRSMQMIHPAIGNVHVPRSRSFAGRHGSTNRRYLIHQLPPIQHSDLPERPNAPTPCTTPPGLDGSVDEFDDKPIDYIDA